MKTENPTASRPGFTWQRLVIGSHPKRTLIRIFVLIIVSFGLFRGPLLPIRVTGISMFPTYFDGSINFVNRLAFVASGPKRGDIVAVHNTNADPKEVLLKRVIALPGETVSIHRGQVLIDGKPLRELYVKQRNSWYEDPRKLGPDEYYVVGDNRSMPQSLHTHGVFPGESIMGRIVLRDGIQSGLLNPDPRAPGEGKMQTASRD
ncbi:MAG TPA: signal peptidase I [Roseimicrobium sp.]|nr:signal peptidase I [Roseimicrobium sp.]